MKDQEAILKIELSINQLKGYFVEGFVVKAENFKEENILEVHSCLSQVVGAFTNVFMEKNIPYNFVLTNNGTQAYIFPRQFQSQAKTKVFGGAWMELSGVIITKTEETFAEMAEEEILAVFKEEYSIKEETFKDILAGVLKELGQIFTIK